MNKVYVVCYKNDLVTWIREFENREAAEEFIVPRPYVTTDVGRTKVIVEPEKLIHTLRDIVSKGCDIAEDVVDEDFISLLMKDTYNKEYYDIDEMDSMFIHDIEQQVVIFKNKRNKYIKGIVFQNGISVDGAIEYDSLEECKKGGEKRKTITKDIYIEGGVVYVESTV